MSFKVPNSYADPQLKILERKLKASHESVFIDVTPEDWADVSECYPNVQRKVTESGGRMVLGWQVWKTPYLIEGEMHAVWENPEGDLVDITPKDPAVPRILFIEDENLLYDGVQVNNVRINTTQNNMVDDFISICDAIYLFDNKGERAYQYELDLTEQEKGDKIKLLKLKDMAASLVHYGQTRNSACACGSPESWSSCHGKNLSVTLRKLVG
jgi:hypothetical protein